MTRRLIQTVGLLLMGACIRVTAKEPEVHVGIATSPIRLDGILDEPAWPGAGIIPDLTQQNPRPEEPTPYFTEIRLLRDGKNFYLGIRCEDPDPRKIAIHTLKRDGDMSGDDAISVVLDTYRDHRTGFLFRVNAGGARLDGLLDGSNDISTDWDGIWDARVRRDDKGWTLEMEIPAQTLHFTPGRPEWGLEIQRYVARDRLTLRWSGTTLDSSLSDLRRAGILTGMEDLHQGRGISFAPFGLGRVETDFQADHRVWKGSGGFDASYSLTPGLVGVLTVNTDFAETEVDERQINLTRFPLFDPEKRTFFLEGSNQFTFGSGTEENFIAFYSRRVGLYNGQVSPIDAGLKFIGRAGRWGIAVLDVQTRDSLAAAGTNLFAGRFTYDVDPHLRLGTILTNGDPDGVSDNSLLGIDAQWSTSSFRGDKNLSAGAWFAKSMGDIPAGRTTGWGVNASYPNDLWDLYASFNEYGNALDPALGFIPRPGTRQYEGGGAYQPRPQGGPFGWIRQFYFEFEGRRVDNLDGTTESWRIFTAPFNASTQSGEHLEFNWAPQYEFLDEPFEISEGVVIPPGRYQFHRFRAEAQTATSRPWRVGATVWFGSFFGGDLLQVYDFVTWTSSEGMLQLSLETENDFGTLPWGNFVQRLWQAKGTCAFSPNLAISSYFQYDSASHEIGMNNRFIWTLQPGRELYVVWNRGWKKPIDAGFRDSLPEYDLLAVKFRWTFRM